ncbi:MAG TPA: hypothetical protein GX506_07395 [Firmicutes bacterium]|nr:hypothetical protein [Bacillota bacterium]
MGEVHHLYYDTWIGAAYKLMDYLAEAAAVWDDLPSYRREGKLIYFNQLIDYLCILRSAHERGTLTKAQERKWRNLERLAENALKLIKHLEAKENERRAKAEIRAAAGEATASGEEAGGESGKPEADS